MKMIDMSEKAILKRFDQTEQLREVSRFLMKAKKNQDENLNKAKKETDFKRHTQSISGESNSILGKEFQS